MDISKVKDVLPYVEQGMGIAFGGMATYEGIKATFDMTDDGYDRDYICDRSISLKEKTKIICKYYWKVGMNAGLALGCFSMAMRGYSSKVAEAASMTSIAAYWKKYAQEYRAKNRELYGEENDKNVDQAVIKDHISQNPPPKRKNSDAFLIYDPVTDQYFEATQKELDNCEREMNRILGKASPVQYWFFLKHFRNAKWKLPICEDIGWFLDDSYYDYHYYNESFYAHEYFEIYLDPIEAPEGDVYVLRTNIEPMLDLGLDADVVKDSQDKQCL